MGQEGEEETNGVECPTVPENPWKKLKERMKLNEKRAKRIYLCDVNLETLLKEQNFWNFCV